MRVFSSFLAPHIEDFIKYRKVSENWNDHCEQNLHYFDNYCATFYANSSALTQEMIDKWCKQRATEKNNSCRRRNFSILNFVNYLRSRGETNVNPPVLPREERRNYIPHAFTEYELKTFFNACDNLQTTDTQLGRSRKLTVPVFFRLLYSSGIRTTEARHLRVAEVDLKNGVLNIQRSKGHSQHYIALHKSMTALLREYDTAICKIYPNREYFFPGVRGENLTKQWVTFNFKKTWYKSNDSYAVPYALRHHYATSNINEWISMGFDFDDKLLYLSKSMGHRNIESTKYYYSLVPGLADIIEDKTNVDFEYIVPEVVHEEV